MADGWLLKGIQELVDKIKLLEGEKRLATARTDALEREKNLAAATIQDLEREAKQAAAAIQALEREAKQAAATIQALEREAEQAAVTMQEFERERKQAAITIQGLERQVGEQGSLIALASEKVAEALSGAATEDTSWPGAVQPPLESKDFEGVVERSPGEPRDMNQRSPRVFDAAEYSTR